MMIFKQIDLICKQFKIKMKFFKSPSCGSVSLCVDMVSRDVVSYLKWMYIYWGHSKNKWVILKSKRWNSWYKNIKN